MTRSCMNSSRLLAPGSLFASLSGSPGPNASSATTTSVRTGPVADSSAHQERVLNLPSEVAWTPDREAAEIQIRQPQNLSQ